MIKTSALLLLTCLSSTDASTDVQTSENAVVAVVPAHLGACIEVKLGESRLEQNLRLVPAKFVVAKSTGECGCKSAGISYEVMRKAKGRTSVVRTGVINTLKRSGRSTPLLLVLSENGDVEVISKYEVTFSCASPS